MAAGKIVSVSYWPAPLAYFEDLPKSKATYKELTAAMKEAAIHIKDSHPQTIVILSRYRYTLRDAIGYSPQPRLRGALQPSGGAWKSTFRARRSDGGRSCSKGFRPSPSGART